MQSKPRSAVGGLLVAIFVVLGSVTAAFLGGFAATPLVVKESNSSSFVPLPQSLQREVTLLLLLALAAIVLDVILVVVVFRMTKPAASRPRRVALGARSLVLSGSILAGIVFTVFIVLALYTVAPPNG